MTDQVLNNALSTHETAIRAYAAGTGTWDDVLSSLEDLDFVLHAEPSPGGVPA